MVLMALGQSPSDEEIAAMFHSVDNDASGEIEFHEFCQVPDLFRSSRSTIIDFTAGHGVPYPVLCRMAVPVMPSS